MLRGKRKFTIAAMALLMSFVLAFVDVVDGGNWVAVVGLVVGLYGGAEAAEGMAHARSGEE